MAQIEFNKEWPIPVFLGETRRVIGRAQVDPPDEDGNVYGQVEFAEAPDGFSRILSNGLFGFSIQGVGFDAAHGGGISVVEDGDSATD